MTPLYSRHARRRMQERSITESEVEFVIEHHDTEFPDKDGNRELLGDPEGRRIKVVIGRQTDPPFVITTAPEEDE